MHNANLKEIIKNRRKILGISQNDLSEISGIGLRTLKQLERGKGNPTLEVLNKLAEVLGLELLLIIRNINEED